MLEELSPPVEAQILAQWKPKQYWLEIGNWFAVNHHCNPRQETIILLSPTPNVLSLILLRPEPPMGGTYRQMKHWSCKVIAGTHALFLTQTSFLCCVIVGKNITNGLRGGNRHAK